MIANNNLNFFKALLIIWFVNNKHIYSFKSEFYSSTAVLEDLLRTEKKLLGDLQTYLDNVKQHVAAIYGEIQAIESEHIMASRDIEKYLNNPVNSFRLIKRLHIDWPTYKDVIADETSQTNYLEANNRHMQSLRFPSSEDFVGSAIALTRLQETYQLDVSELSRGFLNGVKYGMPMSWQDCFVLGQHLYAMGDYNHTIPWLKLSTEKLRKSEYGTDRESLDFIESVIDYHREMGDYESALNLTRHVLIIDPQRSYLYKQKMLLEKMITDGVKDGLLHNSIPLPDDYHQSNEFQLYKKVCRGDIQISPAQQRSLRCRYYSNNVGFRRLLPFQMEELYLDPYILQFHNVISDEDMNIVKNLARPEMKRSQVRALDGSGDVEMSYRTSQSAGFEVTKHPIFQKMHLITGDLSGLKMAHAEEIQVANYGIGGHYEPHWDSFPDDFDYVNKVEGNRIATSIFYLSDVSQGGGTAFPFLPLLVKPERGSILFWYNLHSSGDTDFRTKHAACPVLTGSKWISNIWIRFGNQHHVRPCQLHQDNEISKPFENFN